MSFRNASLVTASVFGALLGLGSIDSALAGHGGHGYGPGYGHGGYHGNSAKPGYYGYGASRPGAAYGYMPQPMHGGYGNAMPGYGPSKAYGMGQSCDEYGKAGYMIKTGSPETKTTGTAAPAKDIVDVAAGAGSFNTLVAAVKAADLVETLKGKGPFTVFAPTDEAFAKIPKADLDALLADKEKLTAVLTYHVVAGKVMAADVVKLKSAKTVQGGTVAIDTSDGVKVDNAKVVKTDVMASNGVIHVIDTVIMPK